MVIHKKADGAFCLNNSVNGTVEKGGTAFYLRGSDINNKANFLNAMFTDVEKNGKVSADGKKLYLQWKKVLLYLLLKMII